MLISRPTLGGVLASAVVLAGLAVLALVSIESPRQHVQRAEDALGARQPRLALRLAAEGLDGPGADGLAPDLDWRLRRARLLATAQLGEFVGEGPAVEVLLSDLHRQHGPRVTPDLYAHLALRLCDGRDFAAALGALHHAAELFPDWSGSAAALAQQVRDQRDADRWNELGCCAAVCVPDRAGAVAEAVE